MITRSDLSNAMKAIELCRINSGGKWGVKGQIKCPKCGGELNYSIASTNGHIWGKCLTKDCLEWMM